MEPIRWVFGDDDVPLALIIAGNYLPEQVEFVTPRNLSQQLALMNRPSGELIDAHTHLPVGREVTGTQEVIVMRSGKMRLDLYNEDQSYVCSELLEAGDIALLCGGGHGFELIEDSFFIEVKQGPYSPEQDKVRFEPTHQNQFKWSASK